MPRLATDRTPRAHHGTARSRWWRTGRPTGQQRRPATATLPATRDAAGRPGRRPRRARRSVPGRPAPRQSWAGCAPAVGSRVTSTWRRSPSGSARARSSPRSPAGPCLTTRYGIELLVDVGEGMRPVRRRCGAGQGCHRAHRGPRQPRRPAVRRLPAGGPGCRARAALDVGALRTRRPRPDPRLALSDLGLGGRPPGRPDLASRWLRAWPTSSGARAAGSSCSSPTRRTAGRRPWPARSPSSPGTVAPTSATWSGLCGAGKGADARRGRRRGSIGWPAGTRLPSGWPWPSRWPPASSPTCSAGPGCSSTPTSRGRERPVVERAGGHAELQRARARARRSPTPCGPALAAPDERDCAGRPGRLVRGVPRRGSRLASSWRSS